MTRLGASPIEQEPPKLVRRVRPVKVTPDVRVRPLQNSDFVWPNIDEIRKVQQQWLTTEKNMILNKDDLIITDQGKVIIPEEAEDLRRRLCVIAHAGGNSGHLGYQSSTQKLTQFFY